MSGIWDECSVIGKIRRILRVIGAAILIYKLTMSRRRHATNMKYVSSTEEEEETVHDASTGRGFKESVFSKKASDMSESEGTVPRRRGRGPSKRPCLNRNALMARENRLRKKAYLEKIENKLSFYQQENKTLANTIQKQGRDIKRLTQEVAYLRSVLNNNTSITALLKAINDGLKRVHSRRKKEDFHSTESEALQKCLCHDNIKENMSEHKNLSISSTSNGLIKNDHTYTALKYSITDGANSLGSKDLDNGRSNMTSTTHSETNYMNDNCMGEFDNFMPITPTSLSNSDGKKELTNIDTDLEQLAPFNDLFDDLPRCDEFMNSVNGLDDASDLLNEEDLFGSLGNTGICLHVNSDKVSLEYCPICHLNNTNMEIE